MLFLDEIAEFPRAALEALREPLETGRITISRAARRSEFPAVFQLIAAMNPCPCGYLGSSLRPCRCSPEQVARYQGKLSGPLLDRIDLQVEVNALPPEQLLQTPPGAGSAEIRARVERARQKALARQGCTNRALQGAALDEHAPLQPAALGLLNAVALKLGWSARSIHRALKVARSVADLADADILGSEHVAEAVQYRRGVLGKNR